MGSNKTVVRAYLTSLGNLDWAAVASYLADDVERTEWADGFRESGVPVRGKAAVLKGLQAPRRFRIETIRIVEEGDLVATESIVRVPLPDGGTFVGRASGLFELENGRLKRMSSWVAEDKRAGEEPVRPVSPPASTRARGKLGGPKTGAGARSP